MKKLSLLLALVLICASLSGAVSLADNPETCTVTFFTTDEYLLMGETGDDIQYDTVVIRCNYGQVLTETNLPRYEILIFGFDDPKPTLAWVENPLDCMVTTDMVFEAYIADKPEEMADVRFFGVPLVLPGGEDGRNYFSDVTIGFPVGYTLTQSDIPRRRTPPPGGGYTDRVEWTPEPVGATVYGGEEFESKLVEILDVYFIDPHYAIYDDGAILREYHDVEYGASVEPPAEDEIPQYPGEVFIGWDSDDYLCVTRYTEIEAEYRYLGDANIDHVVNSGDAAYILRYALGLTESEVHNFDELADYNCDGAVNTGDAAGVLVAAVNG